MPSSILGRFLASQSKAPPAEHEQTKQHQTSSQSTRPHATQPSRRTGKRRREYGTQTVRGCDRTLRLPHQPLPATQHIITRESLLNSLGHPCCGEECLLNKVTIPQLRELRTEWAGFSNKDEQTKWLATLLRGWFDGKAVYRLPVGTVPVVCRTAFLLAFGAKQAAFSNERLNKALVLAGIDRDKGELGPAVAGVLPDVDGIIARHAPKAALALAWWKKYVSHLQRVSYDEHGDPMWHTFDNMEWKQLFQVHLRGPESLNFRHYHVSFACDPNSFELLVLGSRSRLASREHRTLASPTRGRVPEDAAQGVLQPASAKQRNIRALHNLLQSTPRDETGSYPTGHSGV
jgi:hypothetical protein